MFSLKTSVAVLLMAAALAACSKSGQQGDGAGTQQAGTQTAAAPDGSAPAAGTSVEVVPHAGRRGDTFNAVARGVTFADLSFQWYVNGAPVEGATGFSFKAADAVIGDVVTVRMGTKVGEEYVSNGVTLENSLPELTHVSLQPQVFREGDSLYVEATAEDPDGEPVEIRYAWTRNGKDAGMTKMLEGVIKRGDRVSISITPCDIAGCGQPIVLHREIRNIPPMMAAASPYTFDGRVFTQTTTANDPDGDPLTFSLKAAPEGMTVDSSTGQVTWAVPANFTGKVSYTIAASDGNGGEVTQTINFNIR